MIYFTSTEKQLKSDLKKYLHINKYFYRLWTVTSEAGELFRELQGMSYFINIFSQTKY